MPFREDDWDVLPISPYAASKVTGEKCYYTYSPFERHLRNLSNAASRSLFLEMAWPLVTITYAEISKAAGFLNYKPATTFEDGIGRFVEWYRRAVPVNASA